jgi:DNA-binding response OmpR family regulator
VRKSHDRSGPEEIASVKILIADDDPISRRLLEATLQRTGYEVVVTETGHQALDALTSPNGAKLAILDWMMPEIDGVEICRRVRQRHDREYVYLLLLTARGRKDDLVTAFKAGVDDYLIKPFDLLELRSRLAVGERLINLQNALNTKVRELEDALSHVKQLQGLIPICMHCKKIRDDESTWHRLETYLQEHSGAMFTHSLCNDCLREHYPNFEDAVIDAQRKQARR